MAQNSFSVVLTSEIGELTKLPPLVESLGEAHDLNPRTLFHINLVLDEVVTNIISYGYPDGRKGRIEISLEVDDGCLSIDIEDDADPFNPLEHPEAETELPPDEREQPVGGLGIHFMRCLSDHISYNRESGKNRLNCKKSLNEEACA